MITLTESAAKQIGTIQKQQEVAGKSLRVYVEGGCCSSRQYGMAFDTKQATDEVLHHNGIEVVIDPESASILKDSVIDYVEGPQGAGFQIKDSDPHGGCGCGHSH
jgi:iron-sulfur cluster assembly accessory protein